MLATGTVVSASTIRRLTEQAGAVWCQVELALVEALEQTACAPDATAVVVPERMPVPDGAVLGLSSDGAMVPLVGGDWTEARTVVIGQVAPAGRMTPLSYASHVTGAATFTRLALAELTRRGVPGAASVVAVTDGAVWIQEVLARSARDPGAGLPPCRRVPGPGGAGELWAGNRRDTRVVRSPASRAAARRSRAGPDRAATQCRARHGAQLPDGAGRHDRRRCLRCGRAADRQWRRGTCQHAGDRGAAHGRGHALDARPCRCDGRASGDGGQRSVGNGLAAHRDRTAGDPAAAYRPAPPAASHTPLRPHRPAPTHGVDGNPTAAHPWKQVPACASRSATISATTM
jgi:hypothetical protein